MKISGLIGSIGNFHFSIFQAEARLAARRLARAEAREIRMRELERQQKEAEENADRVYDMNTGRDTKFFFKKVKKSQTFFKKIFHSFFTNCFIIYMKRYNCNIKICFCLEKKKDYLSYQKSFQFCVSVIVYLKVSPLSLLLSSLNDGRVVNVQIKANHVIYLKLVK